MSGGVFLGLFLGLLLAVLAWLLFGSHGASDVEDPETREAEEEVRNLGASTLPEDADEELPDWGPGAPRP